MSYIVFNMKRREPWTLEAAFDRQVILKAMNSKFKDLEDAIQNYACESLK